MNKKEVNKLLNMIHKYLGNIDNYYHTKDEVIGEMFRLTPKLANEWQQLQQQNKEMHIEIKKLKDYVVKVKEENFRLKRSLEFLKEVKDG